MPTISALQLPPPKNWQDFEALCCDLWREVWEDPNAQKNGRQGQPQHGVDVFGRSCQDKEWAGIQCKGRDNYTNQRITEEELRDEVTKAQTFAPALADFAIATTAPRDVAIQTLARELTEQHKNCGLFSVHVWSWDDIVESLGGFPKVAVKHYPQFFFVYDPDFDRFHNLKEFNESLAQLVPQPPATTVASRTAFKVDVFANAMHQVYENARAMELFVIKEHGHKSLPCQYHINHSLPEFPPLDPHCFGGASKQLYDIVRKPGGVDTLPANYAEIQQAAVAEGCVNLCTGFEELLSRATLREVAPSQDPDRLNLPITQYILDNLDDLTRDPLASAVFERISYLRFESNGFVADGGEDINRKITEVYAELYVRNLPAGLCEQVQYLADSKLAKHQVFFARLCELKEEIQSTPNYFNS